ncbi:MAG: ABC transporter permease [Actinobacteria bacterium]|nr:ABC transporter permease [Actinomycetota bacterium]
MDKNNKNNLKKYKGERKRFSFLSIYSALIYLFLYIPLFVVVVFSFNSVKSTVSFEKFTLSWYVELFKDSALMSAFLHSIEVSLISVLIAVIIGTSGAFFLVRANFPGKKFFMTLAQLPYVLPGIIVGIALLIFFISLNLKLSAFTIILGHISFTTPVVLMQMMSRIQRLGRTYEEAAQDLGANPLKTFFLVTLPLIKTAIIGAAFLAFTISFDEIVITYFLTGTWNTLPVYIYGMMRFGLSPKIYAVSSLVLVLSIIMVYFMARFTGKTEEASLKK